MRIVVSDFMSLDGVVQAPGGPDEDTEGGFTHGGWSMPYFDPDAMGRCSTRSWPASKRSSSVAEPGRSWPRPGRDGPVTPSPTG